VQARLLGKPSTDFIAGGTVAEVPIQECEAVGGVRLKTRRVLESASGLS
jgi:hypothetical protein